MSADPNLLTEALQLEAQLPALRDEGHHGLAAALGERLLDLREAALGPAHPDTLQAIDALAEDFFELDQYDRASALLERLVAARAAAEPVDAVALSAALSRRADMDLYREAYETALAHYEQALVFVERCFGPRDVRITRLLGGVAQAALGAGSLARAEEVSLRLLEMQEPVLGPEHGGLLLAINCLRDVYRQRNDERWIVWAKRREAIIEATWRELKPKLERHSQEWLRRRGVS